MKDDSTPEGISRRKFLSRVGTGIVGSYAVFPVLKSFPDKIPAELKQQNEGQEALKFKLNGRSLRIFVDPEMTLAELIRDKLRLTGTKIACNNGECGSCTVIVDGDAVYSCHMLALDADGKEVLTIEGLLEGEKLHPVQQAFIDEDGLQCGFCTPGQIMAAYALLKKNPAPTKDEILEHMSGNICRCGAYPNIINSVQTAAVKMK